jgi:outer membrane protein TolC
MSNMAALCGAALAVLTLALPLRAQQPLTLQQSIDIARRRGYAAQAALRSRDAARARDRAFSARLLPQLSLSGMVPAVNRSIVPVTLPDGSTQFASQRQTQSRLGLTVRQPIPLTGGQLTMGSEIQRLDVQGAQNFRSYTSTPFTIGISQDILRSNSLSWDAREQDVRMEAAEQQYLESREDQALQVSGAFFDAYAARVQLSNTTANAAVNDTLYNLSKGRFEVGKIGENDLLQSELQLLRSRNALDAAKLELERTMAVLRRLLNVPADTSIDIVAPTQIPTVPIDTSLAVSEALRNRSQVLNLELQGVQARRRVTEARLNTGIGATISASAGFNQTAPVIGEAYQSLLAKQQYTVQVDVPIIQWGAHRAQVEAARADQDQTANSARAARDQIAQESKFAALQLSQSERQLVLAAKADTVANKRFDVAKNRYVIGRIGIGDLFIAQNEKDQAVQAYVTALRGYWSAYYQLRRLTLYDFERGQRIR